MLSACKELITTCALVKCLIDSDLTFVSGGPLGLASNQETRCVDVLSCKKGAPRITKVSCGIQKRAPIYFIQHCVTYVVFRDV